MTYRDFISDLDPKEVDSIWGSLEHGSLKAVEGTKYYLKKEKKLQPFKSFIYHLIEIKGAQVSFSSTINVRNAFCEKFDFEIEEVVEVVSVTEQVQYDRFIASLKNKEAFRSFMVYCYDLIGELQIDAYRIRFALVDQSKLKVILAPTVVLTFSELHGKTLIGFYFDEKGRAQIEEDKLETIFEYKEVGNAILGEISILSWEKIAVALLMECKSSIKRYYDEIKGSRRVTWNHEAKAANNAFKHAAFDRYILDSSIDRFKFYPLVNEYVEWLIEKSYANSTITIYGRSVQTAVENVEKKLDFDLLEKDAFGKEELDGIRSQIKPDFKGSHSFLNFLNIKTLGLVDLESITVWKLGCNWGSGARSFYDYIKDFSLVLSHKDFRFKKGDLVLITEGFGAKAIAQVLEDMESITSQIDVHGSLIDFNIPIEKEVLLAESKWRVLQDDEKFEYRLQQGIRRIQDEGIRRKVFELWKGSNKNPTYMESQRDLNTILYGPPGTGKTYNTIDRAVQIVAPDKYTEDGHRENKQVYDELVSKGQVVFTTFHQSLSYEDFIEGMKPMKPEEGDEYVKYEVVPGVFREICVEAAFSIAEEKLSLETEDILDFTLAYDLFIENVEEQLSIGEMRLTTRTGGEVLVDSVSDRGNVIIKHLDGSRTYTVSKQRLSKLNSEIKDLDGISNINDQFREIIGGSNSTAYWTVLNAILNQEELPTAKDRKRSYTYAEKLEVVNKMSSVEYREHSGKPYVLIIDEINRGNISQIFGELISLLESDKRAGKDESLTATLVYSRDKFSVPPNLYIIGTMNTADRSVEALDVALRRRFMFEHMPPKPDLLSPANMIWRMWWKYEGQEWEGSEYEKVEGTFYDVLKSIDISNAERIEQLEKDKFDIWTKWDKQAKTSNQSKDLDDFGLIGLDHVLETINQRITYLKDEDHQIGHSYFANVFSLEDFSNTFNKNIIPLLKEYFYSDHGKIRMVLGDGFVERKEDDAIPKMAVDDEENLIEMATYKIKEVTANNITGAISKLGRL